MLTFEDVKEILNIGTPMLYSLLRSGELRGVQIGGRGYWRISEDDLAAYLEQAYKDTQERIASGEIPPGDEAAEDTGPA
jgi:excisionase family DNA binding protein